MCWSWTTRSPDRLDDRPEAKRLGAALGLLLSQGRAVGVVVIGAVQDPRKEVLTVRDLFPTRIALRQSEAEQMNLVLGPGARNRGAICDRIPESLPGVGYVIVDGIAEPVRVRFSHITDAHIATLGRPSYPEPAQLVAVPESEEVAASVQPGTPVSLSSCCTLTSLDDRSKSTSCVTAPTIPNPDRVGCCWSPCETVTFGSIPMTT